MTEPHFNKLSPANHELLVKLAEEASEISKAVCQILLHGLESTEPGCALTNQEKLQNELGDLVFFLNLAMDYKLVNRKEIDKAAVRRSKRVNHYLHHVEID